MEKKKTTQKKKSTSKKKAKQFVPVSPNMDESEREMYLGMLSEEYEDKPMAIFDDFNDCLLYWTEDEDGNACAVYCYEDLVESFARRNNCTYTEAVEYIDYNTMRTIPYMSHVGDTPTTRPVIIHRINRDFTTHEPSFYEKTYSDE
jgi:hypothetical protein